MNLFPNFINMTYTSIQKVMQIKAILRVFKGNHIHCFVILKASVM